MLRRYYDMHVTTQYSGGSNSVEEVIRFAERLGLDTIVLLEQVSDLNTLNMIRDEVRSVKSNVNVLVGVEIKAENANVLGRTINKIRDSVDILGVYGGELDINRAACENPKVDILTHPELKRKDSGMDHVMMKLAADNHVAIELNFNEYLYSYKKVRCYVLDHMTNNAMLAGKYGASVVVGSGAKSIWDMRAGRELASLAYLSGLDREKSVKTVSDTADFIVKRVLDIKASMGGVIR